MPHMWGVVTARAALVAMAASTAFPPARSTATPASDACRSTEHTTPSGPGTDSVDQLPLDRGATAR